MTLAHELRTTPEFKQRIDGEFLESLRRAIPLHDIGKVTVPDHILLKPGKLTPPEITIMQRHAEMGATTLESVVSRSPDARFLRMAVEIARCHHERYDGSGYPQGLSSEQIPLAARIASVADVYDALTSPRPYKEDMAHETAVSLIRAGAGSQFDPMVVAAFLKREADLATAARELADGTGRTAEIPRRFSSRLHEGTACVPLR
jgi:putative two-component system response regulator